MGEREERPDRGDGPGAARAAPDAGELPHALTFFLSAAQRRAVLAGLKRIDGDRARALLRALKIEKD